MGSQLAPPSIVGTTDQWGNITNYTGQNPAPWNLLAQVIEAGLHHRIPGFGSSVGTAMPGISGAQAYANPVGFPVLPWAASTTYAVGAVRSIGGNIYQIQPGGNGTSASSGGPSGTGDTYSANITDGGCTWRYVAQDVNQWAINTAYTAGQYITNLGYIYVCTVSGTSASSGSGPNANNTGIVDNGATWNRVQYMFIDTVNGNDSNSGLTPALAKKSIAVQYSVAANTILWLAAGGSQVLDFTQSGQSYGILHSNTWTGQTVYDRTTGNEIVSQPNPFARALQKQWITPTELSAKYFKIIGNGPSILDSAINGTNGKGVLISNSSGVQAKVRGVWAYGCPYAGFSCNGSIGWVVADSCFMDTDRCIQTGGASTFAGAGIRLDGTTSQACLFSRMFIYLPGRSAFVADSGGATNAVGWQLTDSAIYHKPNATSSYSHCDCVKYDEYPGAAVVQRVAMEHDMSAWQAIAGTNPGGCVPVGACFLQDTTGTAGTNNITWADCICVSNNTVTNTSTASTVTPTRMVLALIPQDSGFAAGSGSGVGIVGNAALTFTNSVFAYRDSQARNAKIYQGAKPTFSPDPTTGAPSHCPVIF